jgi:hypothetical protein
VPLEEMDIVFGEGIFWFLSRIQISDQRSFCLHIMIGGENKHARYSSSSGGLTRWFKRIFTKDGSSMGNNRTRSFTEREESYAPLRADHDHDHDHDHDEGQDADEDEGEEYEMIKRKSSHDSES